MPESPLRWRPVLPGVFLFEDSCLVYAVRGPAGMLVVDAGTGASGAYART